MNDIERDLRRRLKKSICKRTELNNKVLEHQKEKQELIEYLKKEIEQLENIPKDEEMTLEAHGRLNAYRIILLKIEKR